MKVATMPDGPTITFRITEYTLSGDIKSTQKKPISLSEMALYSPAALIMNNISPQSGPKHLQAMASSIQMMFAKFSPEHEAEELCRDAVSKKKLQYAEDAVKKTDEATELEKKLKETKTNVENQKKCLKIM